MQQINSSSLYRDVIWRALVITWRHPLLWIFGFFTTFLGLGGIYQMIIGKSINSGLLFGQLTGQTQIISLSGLLVSSNLGQINISNLLLLFGAIFLILALLVFFIYLSISSFGALIFSASAIDKKKPLRFWKNFSQGRAHFWRLLAINLIGKILIFAFLALVGGLISLIIINNSISRALLYFFAFLILVAASLIISFLTIYGSSFVVLKSRKLIESVESAWELFKENWVVSIEAAAIMFLLNLLAQAVIFAALIVFSLPYLLMLLLIFSASVTTAPVIILALWITTSIIIMIVAGSFFSTLQIVVWTLLFDKMVKGGVMSKLHRIFG